MKTKQVKADNADCITSYNDQPFVLEEPVWDFFRNEWGQVLQINGPPTEPITPEATADDQTMEAYRTNLENFNSAKNNRMKVVFESGVWRWYTVDGRINDGAKIRNLRHGNELEVVFPAPPNTLGEKDLLVKFYLFINDLVHKGIGRMSKTFAPKLVTAWTISLLKKLSTEDVNIIRGQLSALKKEVEALDPRNITIQDDMFFPFKNITAKGGTKDEQCISVFLAESARIQVFLLDEIGTSLAEFLIRESGKSAMLTKLIQATSKPEPPKAKESEEK